MLLLDRLRRVRPSTADTASAATLRRSARSTRSNPLIRTAFGLICALAVIASSSPAVAQFANGALAGTVTGADGAQLPGVQVTTTSQATGQSRTTFTAANGSYLIDGLRPASYTVSFSLDGFKTHEESELRLVVGQTQRLDVSLEVGDVSETITVTGTASLIEFDSKEVGGTITNEELEVLPSANRSALLFAALLPGVVPNPDQESTSSDSLFVNGQSDQNNNFNVDGANNDDDVIGAVAGAQTRTSIEAIQEFEVLTSQFDAEFGRAVGGVLNAVTKSGTNAFRGSAWLYRQDASLNDEDFFVEANNLREPDTEYENLGFNLGGPLVRDRLHFFVNYEDISDQEGVSRSFATRPEFDFTTIEDNAIENSIVKLDYQAGDSHHFAGRYLREESPQFNQIIGGQVTLQASREEDDTDSNWIASWDAVLGPRALNIARVSFTKEDVSFANPGFNNNGQNAAAQRALLPFEDRPGIDLGNNTVAQSRVNRSTQFDDTFSWVVPDWHGEHALRAGVQYSNREEDFFNFGTLNGDFTFGTDRAFDPNDLSTYPLDFTIRVGGPATAPIPDNETIGVFVQDDWAVNDRVTVNLGLRWDDEEITDDSNNIAPRLGFAWTVDDAARTVVRGGAGRFYNRFRLGSYSGFFLDGPDLSSGFLRTLPTAGQDPQFFFDIVQANGFTTLTELRDFLSVLLENDPAGIFNTSPQVDNPNRVQSYTDSFSIGVQRELWNKVALSVDVIHAANRDGVIYGNLNPFSSSLGGRPNISVRGGAVQTYDSIFTPFNVGERDYDAIQFSLARRADTLWGGRLSVTYGEGEGNFDGDDPDTAIFQTRTETGYDFDRGVVLGEAPTLNLEDPRYANQAAAFDRDLNVVLSGQVRVPRTSWRDNGGLVVAGVFRYLTGDRFTILDNSARLDNGVRAPAAPGSYSATDTRGRARTGVSFNGEISGAELPNFQQLDLSLRYRIPLTGRYQLGLVADVFNVTDRVNFDGVGSTRVDTGGFLVPTAVFPPRRFQLAVRFDF